MIIQIVILNMKNKAKNKDVMKIIKDLCSIITIDGSHLNSHQVYIFSFFIFYFSKIFIIL